MRGALALSEAAAAVTAHMTRGFSWAPTIFLYLTPVWGGCFVPRAASSRGAAVNRVGDCFQTFTADSGSEEGDAVGAQMGATPQA